MRTIYKYPLPVTDTQVIELPLGAVILHVDKQGAGMRLQRNMDEEIHMELQLWAMVDTEAESTSQRTIRIIGTGHPADDVEVYQHVSTVIDGPLVWHVFEDPLTHDDSHPHSSHLTEREAQ